MAFIITTQAVLGHTATNTEDREIALSLFTAMLIIDSTFLGPAAFLSLFSGIVLAVGTRWGLLRRYWVATKFSLMLVLMLLPILFCRTSRIRATRRSSPGVHCHTSRTL